MSYQLLHSSPCFFQIKLGFINRVWSKCFINHQVIHTENDLESMQYRQQDVMIDMSMVYCWLNLRHKSSHKFFVIYVCIPQYVSDCFFAALTITSWAPPKCGAAGGLNEHWTALFCCVLLDLLLIQLIHQIFRFFLCFHKITSIVWKHYFRNTSSTCHSRKCAKKWINIHLEWHLQMYCLGIQTRE